MFDRGADGELGLRREVDAERVFAGGDGGAGGRDDRAEAGARGVERAEQGVAEDGVFGAGLAAERGAVGAGGGEDDAMRRSKRRDERAGEASGENQHRVVVA